MTSVIDWQVDLLTEGNIFIGPETASEIARRVAKHLTSDPAVQADVIEGIEQSLSRLDFARDIVTKQEVRTAIIEGLVSSVC